MIDIRHKKIYKERQAGRKEGRKEGKTEIIYEREKLR